MRPLNFEPFGLPVPCLWMKLMASAARRPPKTFSSKKLKFEKAERNKNYVTNVIKLNSDVS